jgi:hypothetical protein
LFPSKVLGSSLDCENKFVGIIAAAIKMVENKIFEIMKKV